MMIMFTAYKEKLVETNKIVFIFFCLWYINRGKCLKRPNSCILPILPFHST